jgi:protein TonB
MGYASPAYKHSLRGSSKSNQQEALSADASLLTEETDEDFIFSTVEQMAEFTGDKNGVEAFIKNKLNYPPLAMLNNTEGIVYVEFVIDTDGSVSGVQVLSSSDTIFEAEAIRLIRLTNKRWKAAVNSGKKVKSRMVLSVEFKLN